MSRRTEVMPSGGGEGEPEELSIVNGNALTELKLPRTLKKVGAYGFYNCENLRSLELYSTTMDWGAGVFTGCLRGSYQDLCG